MAYTYKSDGVILKRWPHRDKDKMVRVLTRDFGKVTARAISARKITSKLAGSLEPYVLADFFFAKSKTIDIIAGSSVIASHTQLRQSMHHVAAAGFFAEVVDRFTHDRESDVLLFDMVLDALSYLNKQETINALVVYTAIIHVLEHLGYRLELYTCHNCKRAIQPNESMKLHYQLWSLECENCKSVEDVLLLNDEAIKVLRFIQDNDYEQVARLQVAGNTWAIVDQAIRQLLQYHIDGPLYSEQVFLELLVE